MKVLIACEFSGIVREAFKKQGHEAFSCDLLPTEIPGNHYQGDVFDNLPKNKQQRLHYLPPSKDRWKIRSRTFQGIASAMAEQWGKI